MQIVTLYLSIDFTCNIWFFAHFEQNSCTLSADNKLLLNTPEYWEYYLLKAEIDYLN